MVELPETEVPPADVAEVAMGTGHHEAHGNEAVFALVVARR